MSHYGPKWQVISNLSLTPVWTRIREPSMKADTPIFEFVICNGRGGGEQFIMGCSRSCETFQPIMDTYSSIRWSEKFVKNRERKEFLIIDLWSHIYKYRVGIKLSFNFREKYIYTHIFFFKSKCDLSHVRSSPFSICQECRFRGFPLLLPPGSARTLKQPRAHDLVDKEEAGRGDRKYRTCARANRGLYEHRRGEGDGVRKIRKAWKTSYRNNGE